MHDDGPRRPLTQPEIAELMARLERVATHDPQELATLRTFLDQDDGREFAMLNLVRLAPEPIPHPKTGVPTPAMKVLEEYTKDFFPALLRRGGPQLLPAVFSHSQQSSLSSLDALALLDTEVLLPGHGDVWRGPIREATSRAISLAGGK